MPGIDTTSEAVRILMARYELFDGAKPAIENIDNPIFATSDVRELAQRFTDDRVTAGDLQAVLDGEGFTETERQAAQYLLDHPGVLDALDVARQVADGGEGGDGDGRISQDDVIAFIDAHRDSLEPETVAAADARVVLDTGVRDGWTPGDQPDDHDARLVAFAGRMADPPGGDVQAQQRYRDALLAEVLRLDPSKSSDDRGAPVYWLQRERLEALGPDGEGRISPEAYAVLDAWMPQLPSQLPDRHGDELRIMSLNVSRGANNLEPWADAGIQGNELGQVADAIIAGRIEVAALQEVFEGDAETIVRLIEERGGGTYELRFDEATSKPDLNDPNGRDLDKPFGNAVLVRTDGERSLSIADAPPVTTALAHDGEANRSVAGYRILVDGQPITLFNTHATTEDGFQDAQIDAVLGLAAAQDGPVLVMGDFNVDPERMAEIRAGGADDGVLSDLWVDRQFTGDDRRGATGSYGYGDRIDYVFGNVDIGSRHGTTVNVGEADHAGVVLDITVPRPG